MASTPAPAGGTLVSPRSLDVTALTAPALEALLQGTNRPVHLERRGSRTALVLD